MSEADAGAPVDAARGDAARGDAAPMAPRIGLIWAEAEGHVIGRNGGMPWHVPEDLAHFKSVTLGSPVVMGRKTWESLSTRYRPLPGRRNIVITRRSDWAAEGADVAASIDDALSLVAPDDVERVWFIGGGQLYAEAIGLADRLEITELRHPEGDAFVPIDSDVYAPAIPAAFKLTASDPLVGEHVSRSGARYRWCRYDRD